MKAACLKAGEGGEEAARLRGQGRGGKGTKLQAPGKRAHDPRAPEEHEAMSTACTRLCAQPCCCTLGSGAGTGSHESFTYWQRGHTNQGYFWVKTTSVLVWPSESTTAEPQRASWPRPLHEAFAVPPVSPVPPVPPASPRLCRHV